MGGHDIWRASLVAEELMRERERNAQHRSRIQEAQAVRTRQISQVTWFGGIKATARFLSDSAREAFAQRRMTEARS